MAAFDLRKHALEHSRNRSKPYRDGRHRRGRFLTQRSLRRARRRRAAFPLAGFTLSLLPPGRSTSPIASATTLSLTVPSIALVWWPALFTGKIGVAVFVRRLLDPGGQKLQIE